ncbi:MAG: RagB/SusD family nutrient uptake outer membrane protein [Bernardetiaceae bacterium]|nr:RagB/SusD family nutrient uptake outer membrane protein [Bernardetiaceae bacterium]
MAASSNNLIGQLLVSKQKLFLKHQKRMNMNFKKFTLTAFTSAVLVMSSCTDLTEETFSVIPSDQFPLTQAQRDAVVGPLYSGLRDYYGNYVDLHAATDEMVVPTRGGDWKDGDNWRRLHEHTWNPTADNGRFNGLWSWAYGQVTAINRQLDGIRDENVTAELRALRAFYHYIMMDNFGRVPIVTRVTSDAPTQSERAQVFEFVERELTEVLPRLSTNVGGEMYGRFNQWVARMVLAKLYLNAEVYTGRARWADVVTQTNEIINGGKFTLVGGDQYFSMFSVNNQGSPETMLAIPFNRTKFGGNVMQMRTLHYLSQLTYDLSGQPWNGFCTLSEFYNSFADNDIRKRGWLVGQQFTSAGQPILDDGQPLVFTPEIPQFEMPAGADGRRRGARFAKYEIQRRNPNFDQDNDFVIFRYSDVFLMRGEALFRSGNQAGALADLNRIRTRAGATPFSALTQDDILAERGREYFGRAGPRVVLGVPPPPRPDPVWPVDSGLAV